MPSGDARVVALGEGAHLVREFTTARRRLLRFLAERCGFMAMTHSADEVPEMHPDESPEVGFAVVPTRLNVPTVGSVEAALIDAGLGAEITLTDLRRSPRGGDGTALLDRIRAQSAELPTPVPDAFDAVVCVPTASTDFTTRLGG